MWIVDVRIGIHECLEDIVSRHLFDALGDALVTLAQDVARLGPLLARQRERQRVILDALAPP
jgi:hypothetical protein